MSSRTAPTDLLEGIAAGDVRALARAATLIEQRTAAGKQLVKALFERTGRAMIIGVTGPPGAGKSTLVSQITKLLRSKGKTIGIIAVDPSSPFSRGAILGDRIRMQDHHADPGVFIRSMATRGKMGGLAQATLELTLLLDASGRDVVLVETVGVGQDEVEVAQVADVTLVVLVPGSGDDVQAIKAGVMEIADLFVINKADLPGADRLEQEIRAMQSVAHETGATAAAPVRRVVASKGSGIVPLMEAVEEIFAQRGHRGAQVETWAFRLRELLQQRLAASVSDENIATEARRVAAKMEDPYVAVDRLVDAAFSDTRRRHGHSD